MGLSVDSTSNLTVNPQWYSVQNQSQVSAAYTESMQVGAVSGSAAVKGANPVQYPNAQVAEAQEAAQQASQQAEQGFNSIAMAYEGTYTSYTSAMSGASYSMVGSNIDVFA